jgi:hypothetical protein
MGSQRLMKEFRDAQQSKVRSFLDVIFLLLADLLLLIPMAGQGHQVDSGR